MVRLKLLVLVIGVALAGCGSPPRAPEKGPVATAPARPSLEARLTARAAPPLAFAPANRRVMLAWLQAYCSSLAHDLSATLEVDPESLRQAGADTSNLPTGSSTIGFPSTESPLASDAPTYDLHLTAQDLSAHQAIRLITESCGWRVEFAGDTIRLGDHRAPFAPMETRRFRPAPGLWLAVRDQNYAGDDSQVLRKFLDSVAWDCLPRNSQIAVSRDRAIVTLVMPRDLIDTFTDRLKLLRPDGCQVELRLRLESVSGPQGGELSDSIDRPAPTLPRQIVARQSVLIDPTQKPQEVNVELAGALPGGGLGTLRVQLLPLLPWNLDCSLIALRLDYRQSPEDGKPATEAFAARQENVIRVPSGGSRECLLLVPSAAVPARRAAMLVAELHVLDAQGRDLVAERPAVRRARELPEGFPGAVSSGDPEAQRALMNILNGVVIKHVEFEEVPVAEVFRQWLAAVRAAIPSGKPFPVAFLLDLQDTERTMTMSMNNLPAGELLRYICMGTGLRYDIDNGVLIVRDRVIACAEAYPGALRLFPLPPQKLATWDGVKAAAVLSPELVAADPPANVLAAMATMIEKYNSVMQNPQWLASGCEGVLLLNATARMWRALDAEFPECVRPAP